jgi:Flp pilus assembly protein TadD
MGLTLRRLNRYEEALEVFRKALALGRNKAGVWTNIGVCLGCMGKLHEAIEALNEAILMRPGDEVGLLWGYCLQEIRLSLTGFLVNCSKL